MDRTEYDVLGYPIMKWDLGGQSKYRKNYVEKGYFDSTDLIFYTVDIQDPDRFDESFQFLKDIIEYFRKSEQKPPYLVICLHKVDPDIINDRQIQTRVQQCEKRVQDLIDVEYAIFQTSIYDTWSLRKAFSKGILKLSPKSSLLNSIMEDFLDITRSDTLLLLDEDALIFSECSHDPESYRLLNIITPRLATMADKLSKYGKDIEVFEGKIGGWVFFKPLFIQNKTFYIVIFNKNKENINEINFALPELTEKITNTLQTFFI